MKQKLVKNAMSFKTWLFGLGVPTIAIVVWWIVKTLICALTGVCLIF